MKILIVHVGRTSNKALNSFIEEFLKRMNRFAQVELKSVDSSKGRSVSPFEVMRVEEVNIRKAINDRDQVILMDESGKSYGSRSFAKMIDDHFMHNSKRMVFVIGGAYGFSENLQSRANLMISLSKMTFNHELALAVLSEQVYRALTIINGHPYHND
ncbi:MAG: 23S rRNA (pseudouridine(1915)-N(3))-methyltransferase RlmH [Flavobacteriales bacterium]|nr:23S rRNA (pseudouridine(1915)-N(3))-methyltransferase RlmH [Flavobacteriales bacterium]